jgi:hypothetical protein
MKIKGEQLYLFIIVKYMAGQAVVKAGETESLLGGSCTRIIVERCTGKTHFFVCKFSNYLWGR